MPAHPETNAPLETVDSSTLTAGHRVFRRYRLQRLIGRGGMGVVWLAHDETLDREVALKFLPDALIHDPAARDDLKRETRRSLDLTHPHIVRIHDFVEDDDAAAIVMEYVDGPTLSQLRVDRPSRIFEVEDLKIWTTALCGALDYAHESARCVHRDLKPSNLMVSARGVLKVADFGIACGLHHTAARMTAWSSTGGTLGYMSPQQLLGELASPSDDIYSVGATLYEMLTGKPPFYSGDISAQIREVRPDSIAARRAQFGLPGAFIPPAWEATIAACLAKQVHERPRRLRDVARQLGLPLTAAAEISTNLSGDLPPTLRAAATRPARRRVANLFARFRQIDRATVKKFAWPVATAAALLIAVLAQLGSPRPEPAEPATPSKITPGEPPTAPAPARKSAAPIAPASDPIESSVMAATVAETNADRSFLQPAAAVPGIPPSVALQTELKVTSSPPGIGFKIFSSAYEAPDTAVIHEGQTPASIKFLPPGSYRVTFAAEGFPLRSASLEVPKQGLALLHQDFPQGTMKVASNPPGAEIFCEERSLGHAPLEVALPVGEHKIGAHWQGRDARVRTITLETDSTENVAFDFRSSAPTSSQSRSRRSQKKEDDTVWEKMGRSINKIFTGGESGKSKR